MHKKIVIVAGLILFNVCPAFAVDEMIVNGENYSNKFAIYNKGEKIVIDDDTTESPFTIDKKYLSSFRSAAQKWAGVLNVSLSPKPLVGYAVFSEKEYNASASSQYIKIKESPYPVTAVNAAINSFSPDEEEEDDDDGDDSLEDIYGFIFLGYGIDEDAPGWQEYSGLHSLYHDYQLADLHTVLLHEIMHSLGITSDASQQRKEDPKIYYFTEKDEDNLSVFDKDLRLYTGDMNAAFDPTKELVPDSTMRVGKNLDFDVFNYSPYYVGETTLKVLSGQDDYDAARTAIINNGGLTNYSSYYDDSEEYPQVYGMPIHNLDNNKTVDLAHLELHNSFMSHQTFRNWLVPMEAELAVLKDIGYDIDLRKYFGKSYYLNDITDNFSTGFSEWNGTAYTGKPSTVLQTVGLHIYGQRNNITQTSDISAAGEGSFGVRIDGVDNTYTLQSGSNIEVFGEESLGIAVTWGEGHIVNIEKGATVTSSGEDGIAVAFDFGNNMFGSLDDARGSYINYSSTYKLNSAPSVENDEALVKQFNVSGTITGTNAAIYISDNARVREINILKDAEINGDIISNWNSVQSGEKASVLRRSGMSWVPVDGTIESQIYFTKLNIAEDFNGTINGSIDGETIGNNTLRLTNKGNPTVNGKQVAVYSMENSGSINVKNTAVAVQNGVIDGGGEINVAEGLTLNSGIEQINNVINLQKGSAFSTANDSVETLDIAQLNSDDASISFDLGDKYNLQNASQKNTAEISQVTLNKKEAETLADDATYELFGSEDKTLDLGSSSASVYYGGKKYYLTQDSEQKNLLRVKASDEKVYLHGAAVDETTANYIVTENQEDEDIGTVRGNNFEVSGNDINVNGYKGMVIDSKHNKKGTVLKTGIFGASDSDISIINKGKLKVVAQDKDITLGQQNRNALYLEDAQATLNAQKHTIDVKGSIIGDTDNENTIIATGNAVKFNKVENVNIDLQETSAQINDVVRNTAWEINDSALSVSDDAFLSSNGSNTLTSAGGTVDFMNNKTSDIKLKKATFNKNTAMLIDVDLQNSTADRLFMDNEEDLIVSGGRINISNINVVDNAVGTDAEIKIPFISEEANNKNLLGKVKVAPLSLLTPVFKYDLGYEEQDANGSFVLTRGDSSRYESYNPAIAVAPVAVLAGGYLVQLNSYDEALNNPDTHSQASGYLPTYSGQVMAMPGKTVWVKPSTSFEKVDLKDGPKVRYNMYNLYAGIDAPETVIFRGWDWQYGIYGGYSYSRQKYSDNTIHQKGGTLGVVARLNKNDFFNATTLNGGVDRAEAETMYGKEKFYIFRYGIADKVGYNWHPYRRNFVVQPSLLLSYTFVKAENYRNAADVNIRSHPLHAFNIAPGILLAYDLPNGWQPYADVKMVWNAMNNRKFEAQGIDLPEMSVKPYIQYGGGVQKIISDKISAYGQVHILDGGRSGVDVTAGIKWEF